MSKSPDAFRSIGEVSRLVGVAPHVLRYWESQFSQLSPVKRADGRRYYRPDDVRLAAGLCQVLREEGLSIRGAKRLISGDRGAGLREIGAARLGEAMGEAADGQRAAPAPAVRLAVPKAAEKPAKPKAETTPEAPGKPAPTPPAAAKPTARQPARQAARPRGSQSGEALPLFPDIDRIPAAKWLGRLAATAGMLRQLQMQGNSLPEQAKALRDSLAAAR